ncbi:MAG: permease prefix domain 1-containing protein [Phycisphaerales bacterium JB058]
MTDAGTDTKAPASAPVKPSSRDPITQWLDVFTSLLSLPAGEVERIRDELEDHLRTRVDDLLILGMTEPEAVQKAVTELGETAQLAQNFKSVRIHSRRRIAMYTALFAAAGLALTVSVAGLLPGGQASPVPASSAIVETQPEQAQDGSVLGHDLPEGTLGETLEMLAKAGDARLFVHWSSLEPLGLDADTEVPAIPAKGLERTKVRQLINSALGLEGLDELDARVEGDLVEIGTVRYFDRIELVLREYDLTDLADPYTNALQTRDVLTPVYETVEPEIWQNNIGSLSFNHMILTVRAPERVQEEVGAYLERLRDRRAAAVSQLQRDQQKREHVQRARQEREFVELTDELNVAKATLDALDDRMLNLTYDFWSTKMDIVEYERIFKGSADERERQETKGMLVNAQVRLETTETDRERLQREIDNTIMYVNRLETQLAALRATLERSGEMDAKDAAADEADSAARHESAGR